MQEVIIPNSVFSIGLEAFFGCYKLATLVLEDGRDSISGLNFPDSPIDTLYLGRKTSDNFMKNKTSLKKLTIGNNIDSIGSSAFYACTGLKTVVIGNSVTSIGEESFSECYNLASVTIGNSVTSIGNSAFFGCYSLQEIIIPNSVTSIGNSSFSSCKGLTSVTIPNSVVSIGVSAFDGCSRLLEVKIPNSVTSIGNSAFQGCSSLQEVTIPNSVTSIGYSTFSGCLGLVEVLIPNSVILIGDCSFSGCKCLTSVTIPNSVTSIGFSAFSDCTSLTSIIIPNSVSAIGNSAFQGCRGLTEVFIPNSVSSIGSRVFNDCIGLTSVTIPNSVVSIGESAFNGCIGLTSITIPNSITKIGLGAFNDCSLISSIVFQSGDNKITIADDAFKNCNYSLIYLGRQIENISSLFNNQKNLKELTIGPALKRLQSDAFEGCTSLEILNIEDGSTNITIDASFAESPIEKLYIGRNGAYAFNNCTILNEVSVGDNVTSIPANAFSGCSNITTLKLGKKLEKIGSGAFTGCATLINVYSANLIPPTGAAFENKTYLNGTLYVVKGYASVYAKANGWKNFWEIIDNLPFEVNDVWYNVDENGNANVVRNPSGDSYAGEITIPASVEVDGVTYPVTSIDAEAFANAINVTSITIEDCNQPLTIGTSATAIMAMSNNQVAAFEACMIDSVYVGRNLNYTIAPFANIASLEKVAVGTLVTTMGGAMFDGCKNINAVRSLSTTPPADAQFDEEVYSNAVLYIAKSAEGDYATADGWKEFINTKTIESSMVEEVDMENGVGNSITVENGEIIVNGTEDALITVYDINGSMIYQGVNRPVAVTNKGVYVIIVNNKAYKVAL